MARTKRDGLKRKSAQVLNNLAKAILDVNEIYTQFDGVHAEHAEYLKQLMLSIARSREGMISFATSSWGLDENQLMKYL